MDPEYNLQDVARCNDCGTPIPPSYCRSCEKNLCKVCLEKHVLDDSKGHKVVPFERRKSLTYCQKHSTKLNDLYCELCNKPICKLCASSKEHEDHNTVDILKRLELQEKFIQNDIQELNTLRQENYEKCQWIISVLKDFLNKTYNSSTLELQNHEESLQRKQDNSLLSFKFEHNKMDTDYKGDLNKQENDISCRITEIEKRIADLKILLDARDDSLVLAYKSKYEPKPKVILPVIYLQTINEEPFFEQLRSLFTFKIVQRRDKMNYLEVDPSSTDKPLIDEPLIIIKLEIPLVGGHLTVDPCSVSCLSDDEFWVSECNDNIIKLNNFQGELVEYITTKSRNLPRDITVSKSGHLVYTDYKDNTVNIVKGKEIQGLIRLQQWKPVSVCCTPSSDLLLIMDSLDKKQTKIVRYSDYIENQSIQFNERGRPLYSSGGNIKYIAENRNLDICVSDRAACLVVVVNKSGSLRFVYPDSPTTEQLFTPYGITTDSQSRILTADYNNNCIHILDQDGQFLRFINNCDIQNPWGLCLDTKGNLIVAENRSRKIKKIKYCKTI